MSDKHGLLDAQGIEDLDIVSCPGLDIVAAFGLARWQPSTAGDPNDVEEIGELECKIIVYVRVVAQPKPLPKPAARGGERRADPGRSWNAFTAQLPRFFCRERHRLNW